MFDVLDVDCVRNLSYKLFVETSEESEVFIFNCVVGWIVSDDRDTIRLGC